MLFGNNSKNEMKLKISRMELINCCCCCCWFNFLACYFVNRDALNSFVISVWRIFDFFFVWIKAWTLHNDITVLLLIKLIDDFGSKMNFKKNFSILVVVSMGLVFFSETNWFKLYNIIIIIIVLSSWNIVDKRGGEKKWTLLFYFFVFQHKFTVDLAFFLFFKLTWIRRERVKKKKHIFISINLEKD